MSLSYVPPNHIAFVRVGKLAGDREVAFWVEAIRIQLQEHVAPAWGLPPPGVFVYDADTFVPSAEGAVIAVVDDDGNDAAAGFHAAIGGVPYGVVDLHQAAVPSRTASHEALELFGNAMLDRWLPGPRGLEYAVELCDACQRDEYTIGVSLFGGRSVIRVSNFVTPAWFGQRRQGESESESERFDYLDRMDVPWSLAVGGYAIARNPDGEVVYLAHAGGAFMEPRKVARFSRTARLVREGAR